MTERLGRPTGSAFRRISAENNPRLRLRLRRPASCSPEPIEELERGGGKKTSTEKRAAASRRSCRSVRASGPLSRPSSVLLYRSRGSLDVSLRVDGDARRAKNTSRGGHRAPSSSSPASGSDEHKQADILPARTPLSSTSALPGEGTPRHFGNINGFDTDSPKEPCWAARGVGFDPEQRYVIAVSDRSPRPGNGKELGKC
ncbi:hypothetical protein AOLI_G00328070 [Acnodon oligacanthus]